MFAGTASAVVGANVSVYIATDTHPNPDSALATTATDSSGMWQFTGLANGQNYDVKVEYSGRTKWYKGNTKHVIGHLTDDTTPDPNRNLIPNGGLDLWNNLGAASVGMPTSDPGVENFADGWTFYCGSGDSGSGNREVTTVAPGSQYGAHITYVRSGAGQCRLYHDLPAPIWQQCMGKTIAASFQVLQSTTTSKLAVYIDDGVGITTGTLTDTTNSWVTISATRAISASATRVRIGVVTARTDSASLQFFVDNAVADFGSLAPAFASDLWDVADLAYTTLSAASAPAGNAGTLKGLLGKLANRITAITGSTNWYDAPATTLAAIVTSLAGKVAKAGDTMSGLLVANGGIRLPNQGQLQGLDTSGTVPLDFAYIDGTNQVNIGNFGSQLLLKAQNTADALRLWINGAGVYHIWHEGNDGTGSGLDADLLRGVAPASLSVAQAANAALLNSHNWKTPQFVTATPGRTLTTTPTADTGVTIPTTGTYLLMSRGRIDVAVGDVNPATAIYQNGVQQVVGFAAVQNVGMPNVAAIAWTVVACTAGDLVQAVSWKASGGGASVIQGVSLTAIWMAP